MDILLVCESKALVHPFVYLSALSSFAYFVFNSVFLGSTNATSLSISSLLNPSSCNPFFTDSTIIRACNLSFEFHSLVLTPIDANEPLGSPSEATWHELHHFKQMHK